MSTTLKACVLCYSFKRRQRFTKIKPMSLLRQFYLQ